MPSGSNLLRKIGCKAKQNELHGGAMKTASNSPPSTRASKARCTHASARFCARGSSRISKVTTITPNRSNDRRKLFGLRRPANKMSIRNAGTGLGCVSHGAHASAANASARSL
jgi:hypothetical protein